MEIVCRGQNVPVSEALVAHCLHRSHTALRPYRSRVARVQFVFVDLNGTRQGLGRACRVTAELLGGGLVRYEGRADDCYRAASQAISGSARHIQRALDRRRDFSPPSPGTTPPAA